MAEDVEITEGAAGAATPTVAATPLPQHPLVALHDRLRREYGARHGTLLARPPHGTAEHARSHHAECRAAVAGHLAEAPGCLRDEPREQQVRVTAWTNHAALLYRAEALARRACAAHDRGV